MTNKEFKAWFDGFAEGIKGCPTDAQWKRIVAKVKEIDDNPVSYPVFVDRYVRPYWKPEVWFSTNAVSTLQLDQGSIEDEYYNSTKAMYALGKSEATL